MVGADIRHLNSAARLLSTTMTQKFEATSCHYCSQYSLCPCVSNNFSGKCTFFGKLNCERISHFRHMHFLLLKDHTLVIQEQTQNSETGIQKDRTGSGCCLSPSEKLSQHQGQNVGYTNYLQKYD